MKILIVEDNPTVRKLIQCATAELDAETVEREDGDEALAAYEIHRPDVVLMDVRMARMDGLTATRLLTARHPTAKVVIVTDYCDDELRSAASEAGACAFASKNNLTDLEVIVAAACKA
jgi:CheY-like chemotaxis protein